VPINELLDELKAQYDKEFETQKIMDKKASTMMATAGTVITLLFGFGTLVVTISPTYALVDFVILSLLAAIITNIFSVFICVKAYYVRDYYFVAKDKSFLKKNPNSYNAKDDIAGLKGLDDDRIRHYIEMEESDFKLWLIRTYIAYSLINADNNDKKAKYVTLAQLTFLIGLVIIPIPLAMVLHASL
jgi:hypothetical protein